MRRLLIAVGCNRYDHLGGLSSAEIDAEKMYSALTRPEIGEYDPSCSILLRSPTSEDVRRAVCEALFSGGVDTFTFFFAGHGGVKSGSFYMCLRDSRSDALSGTAFSLSALLLSLGEAAPRQSNIIIDACESGGLIADLGVLLKGDVLGNANTPGITLFATSAQNETSGETSAGGIGTSALLECIEGREFIQNVAPTLDLVEIGRHVSSRLQEAYGQSPVVWGLNLFGPPRFCKNLSYAQDASAPLRSAFQGWPADSDASIAEHYEQLWSAYASASAEWDARVFANAVQPTVDLLSASPSACVRFLDRFGSVLVERSKLSGDAFRPAQVMAALAACLLRHDGDPSIAQAAKSLHHTVAELIVAAGSELLVKLEEDKYALLAGRGGLSDLFYLPLRISKILAWAAVAGPLSADADKRSIADQMFVSLLEAVVENYATSVATMCDAQAPCWFLVLIRAVELGLTDVAETLFGCLINSLISCEARLMVAEAPKAEVLRYLLMRGSGTLDRAPELIARPNITTTVLLACSGLLGVEDVVDEVLWHLDDVSISAYFNSDFTKFADKIMYGGENAVWQIGLGVFRTQEVMDTWPAISVELPKTASAASGAVISSLLYPDRVPWFLL